MKNKKILGLFIFILLSVSSLSFINVRGITSPTWSVESGLPDDFGFLYNCDAENKVFTGTINITNNDVESVTFTAESTLYLDGSPTSATCTNISTITSGTTEIIQIRFLYDVWVDKYSFGEYEWFISTTLTDLTLVFSETKNTEARTVNVVDYGSVSMGAEIYNPSDYMPYGWEIFSYYNDEEEFQFGVGFSVDGSSPFGSHFLELNYIIRIDGVQMSSGGLFSFGMDPYITHTLYRTIDPRDYSVGEHSCSILIYNMQVSRKIVALHYTDPVFYSFNKSHTHTWFRNHDVFDWSIQKISPIKGQILYNCDEVNPIFRVKVNIRNNIGFTTNFVTKTTLYRDSLNKIKHVYNTKTITSGATESILVNITFDVWSYYGFGIGGWEIGVDLSIDILPTMIETKKIDADHFFIADYESDKIYFEMTNPKVNETIPYEISKKMFSGIIHFQLINTSLPKEDYSIGFGLDFYIDEIRVHNIPHWISDIEIYDSFEFSIDISMYDVGLHTLEVKLHSHTVRKDGRTVLYPHIVFPSFNWYRAEELPKPQSPLILLEIHSPIQDEIFEYNETQMIVSGRISIYLYRPFLEFFMSYNWYLDNKPIIGEFFDWSFSDENGRFEIEIENVLNIFNLGSGTHKLMLSVGVGTEYEPVAEYLISYFVIGENPTPTPTDTSGITLIIIIFGIVFASASIIVKRKKR